MNGGSGADRIIGDGGNDLLIGGMGADVFVFEGLGLGRDRIADFDVTNDRFELSGRRFTEVMSAGNDTVLTYLGGIIQVNGVTGRSLSDWNALVIDAPPPPPPATPQFVQLVPAGAAATVEGSGTVFGASGSTQQITVRDMPGTIAFDGSFNTGGDRIVLSGAASRYSVSRSGATVTISDGDTVITVPVGLGGADIVFGDGVRSLSLDTTAGAVRLGNQVIGATAAAITAPAGPPIATGTTSDTVPSILLVNAGGSATANGRASVFGTAAGAETVTVAPGAVLSFDGSFNAGGDIVRLAGSAASWSVSRSGATVTLVGSGATQLSIPVGPNATTIRFDNGDRPLFLDTTAGQVKLGTTVIGTTASPVAGLDDHMPGDPGLGFIG